MTLIELLVVIVILTTLVAAAIPLMAPSSNERQVREAVRGLNAFVGAAQARAIANGRPFGVALKRLSNDTGNKTRMSPTNTINDNGVADQVYIVEQPAPYSGFDESSRVMLAIDISPAGQIIPGQVRVRFVRRVSPDNTPTNEDTLPLGWDGDPFPPGLIRPGDVVEVDGSRFLLTDTGTAGSFLDPSGYYMANVGVPPGTFVTQAMNGTGQEIQVHYDNQGYKITDGTPPTGSFANPYWTSPAAYKILRLPVPTSDEPYQLPEGTVVDLRASGVGEGSFFFWPGDPMVPRTYDVDNADSVMIMFAPEGRVARVIYNRFPGNFGSNEAPVVENVFLLVGPNVPPPPPAITDKTLNAAGWSTAFTDEEKEALREPINWLRGDSAWLVIGSTTGRVATIENTFVDPVAVFGELLPFTAAASLPEEMRSNQVIAARRFSRDAVQLGGR